MIPGLPAVHCIIKPECRAARGDFGAFEEAAARCRAEYMAIVLGYHKADKEPPEMRLVLTVVKDQ